MSINAVIFDMGGVIVRTDDNEPRDHLAARLGLTREEINAVIFDSPSARLATLGKLPVEQHWAWICQRFQLPIEDAPQVESEFFAGDRVDNRLLEYIRGLRPRVTTALLSNAWSGLRDKLKSEWRFLDAFDQVIISAEVGLAKPDPCIFALTLERLKAAPSEVIFVDDFPENTQAAAAAGLHAVRFLNTNQAIAEIEALLRS